MSDELQRATLASRHVNPTWTPSRERRVRTELERALSRRRAARGALSVVLLLVVALLGIEGLRRALTPDAPLAHAPLPVPIQETNALLTLADGSSVSRLSGEARVTPLEVSPEAITLRLERGEAHFSVVRREGRPFRVLAEDASITVLGTAFSVAVNEADVQVRVTHGRVSVDCRSETKQLRAGERWSCANHPAKAASAAPLESSEPPVAASGPAAARPRTAVSWRALAQEGDYRNAFARMTAEGPSAVRDEPADLLFAADVARLSGHPSDAVARLQRVVRGHAADSRAALAAFTLGRILLDELGRPREAAEAFESSRRLAPAGALAQDALAREVESWSRAGEAALARTRAQRYVERYPEGRRLNAVRRYGGLE